MITKIEMEDVASYKNSTCLKTDKKVNLIYGLNGSGKSVFSRFLYNQADKDFSKCSIEGLADEKILVYNQSFINDIFYESERFPGIFTLSKENKTTVEKIRNAENLVSENREEKNDKLVKKEEAKNELASKKQRIENQIWEIKTKFTGGDRILEFCLKALMGSKQRLFEHISQIKKPKEEPEKNIEELKSDVNEIKGDKGKIIEEIPLINFTGHDIEKDKLFTKEIVGNDNSSVAELIKELDNSDWVQKGLEYLPNEVTGENDTCPFCQKDTISNELINQIKNYFDESYENDKEKIKQSATLYKKSVNQIQEKGEYLENYFVENKKDEFESKYEKLKSVLRENQNKINDKLNNLSSVIPLSDSSEQINSLNELIEDINSEIASHNERIKDKEGALEEIKEIFWEKMRWDYDRSLSSFKKDEKQKGDQISRLDEEIISIDEKINKLQSSIKEHQKKTVNIQDAVDSINNSLVNLGINDFHIKKHKNQYYKLVRDEESKDTFKTLSEGEKMIISFLYFLELCKGKSSASATKKEKIIIIDDPISSLSHIYIFNIGRLIINHFFRSNSYKQVFVLTHSLYFFYEITDPNHDRRKENQNLFRLRKNSDGSEMLTMKYEEIQNDYQSYWQVVKDKNQPPALIANCMRNIIEYFFNFLEKKSFNNVFQKPVLQENKYQAFCRYMNRESHSLGQNIFDYKEFDYKIFKEAFRLVFVGSNYEEHYKRMIK